MDSSSFKWSGSYENMKNICSFLKLPPPPNTDDDVLRRLWKLQHILKETLSSCKNYIQWILPEKCIDQTLGPCFIAQQPKWRDIYGFRADDETSAIWGVNCIDKSTNQPNKQTKTSQNNPKQGTFHSPKTAPKSPRKVSPLLLLCHETAMSWHCLRLQWQLMRVGRENWCLPFS